MKAIDHPSADAGQFRDADPGAGTRGTVVTAEWLNDVQRELLTPITDAGLTPTAGASQLYRAFVDLIFRVGDYVTTESAVTPMQRWPWSTWVQVSGRVLVGLDAAQTEFAAVGQVGGTKAVQLTKNHLPKFRLKTFLPNDGGTPINSNDQLSPSWQKTGGSNSEYRMEGALGDPTLGQTSQVGNDESHTNLQPYRVVRHWRRTA